MGHVRALFAAAVVLPLLAQPSLDAPQVRAWAWDVVKTWRLQKRDLQGNPLWDATPFMAAGYEAQNATLLDQLATGDARNRRAALVVLGTRPLADWGPRGLRKDACRDEVALYLYRHGYRFPDREPFLYLEPASRLERPWTQGLGLHLEGAAWRFQWIPSAALLPGKAGGALPPALEGAPAPTALLRLAHLRPGLQRLRDLAGGSEGLPAALAQGTRAGFLLRHLGPWLDKGGLEGLADREAWILHYGLARGFAPAEGTLVFLPGDLPGRVSLALGLLKLNPTTVGARSRTVTWEDGRGGKAQVTQVRGAGGVLHLLAGPGGTWICDREAPLRAVAFPSPLVTLAERQAWCGVALAGLRPGTEASLWVLPRLGAGAAFERAMLRRRLLGADQPTWANPGIAKAAPRTGALSAALGAGPTEALLQAALRFDQDGMAALSPLPEGNLPVQASQRQAWERERDALARRRQDRSGLQKELGALLGLLDLRGAAFLWNGWTAPEPLTAAQRAALADFQRLRKTDPRKAADLLAHRQVDVYGGFLEPGLAPALALGLPVKAGRGGEVREAVAKLWPRLFKGRQQTRDYAQGVPLHRVLTDQAFRPSWALAGDVLVLATDDEAAKAMLAGILGQAPSLADAPSRAYGRAELDGPRAARDLEILLLAYLRANRGGGYWWMGEPEPSGDEAAAEVASTFGPFLGAVKALGRREVQIELTAGGFEATPR